MHDMGWREKIVLARKARGLSQGDVHRETGVRQATISSWETGTAYPNLDNLIAVTECLRIKLAWLFSDSPDEMPSEEETAVRMLFERRLKAVGPDVVLALLEGSMQSAPRPVGDYSLGEIVGMSPTLSDRKKKRSDTPNSPAGQP